MNFGLITNWNAEEESIDEWLKRESIARERVEHPCCPYCNKIEFDWYELSGLDDYEVTDHEITCSDCEKKYYVDKQTRIRFESKTNKGPT